MTKYYLTKDEFINHIFHELDVRGFEPLIQHSKKLNMPHQKILVLTKYNPARIIYIERHYEDFLKGMALTAIIDEIITMNDDNMICVEELSKYPLNDWFCMRMLIRSRVFSELRNKAHIETNNYPYRKFLDLVEVFYLHLGNNIAIPVDYNLMYLWDVNIDDIINAANQNLIHLDYSLGNMNDTMYLLTLKDFEPYGAASILNTELLKSIQQRFDGQNFYILPSSVHDLILFPFKSIIPEEYQMLKHIVREVNNTEVDEIDRLSYSVYYFDGNEVKLVA